MRGAKCKAECAVEQQSSGPKGYSAKKGKENKRKKEKANKRKKKRKNKK